ncbi:hypothetical protein B0H14DRAFT_3575506 [Mycena olivaceomarginata]|nr:hypothetical protein B0H14DRAFT_3575506 [Mycena olivaceomarginata]
MRSYSTRRLSAPATAGAPKHFVHLVGPPLDVALDARDAGGRRRSKDVPDPFVIGRRFGATDTLRLRRPNTATDTQSISRNIKYTQTPAETGNIGSPETASGIGHTSDQFCPTYSLRISIRSVFRGTYTSLFSE